MDIVLIAKKGGPVQVLPDPATVAVGENVAWVAYYDSPDAETVEWTVYFSGSSPFPGWWSPGSVKTGPRQTGRLEAGSAQSPGDYKYGVRLVSVQNEQLLSDDDP